MLSYRIRNISIDALIIACTVLLVLMTATLIAGVYHQTVPSFTPNMFALCAP